MSSLLPTHVLYAQNLNEKVGAVAMLRGRRHATPPPLSFPTNPCLPVPCPFCAQIGKGPLKRALVGLCAPYGARVAVHATRTAALRGQAWLDFGPGATDKAAAALRDLQGTTLFDKPIVRARLRAHLLHCAVCARPAAAA